MLFKITPSNPDNQPAADAAEAILNHYGINDEQIRQEAAAEFNRQVLYGEPPSEGMPDIRPRYPRWG